MSRESERTILSYVLGKPCSTMRFVGFRENSLCSTFLLYESNDCSTALTSHLKVADDSLVW